MFEELEERFHEVLAALRGASEASESPSGGRIIREVTDPDFLQKQLEVIRASGTLEEGGVLLRPETYEEAGLELDTAKERPDAPFIARTATNSILQSILTTCIESRGDELLQAAPAGMSRVAQAVLRDADIFRQFGPCDPRWVETELAEELAKIAGKPPFPDSPAPPVALAEDARLVIVGDWGTGLPGAGAVSQQMAKHLQDARGRPCHALHLGDVYYSGWREEYETRFLAHWPVARDERDVLCWSLNGNHDMYSGGHGYFGYLLRDPRFRGHWHAQATQPTPSSYFSIEGEQWQILGLDSAYEDHDLAGTQQEWLAQKLATGRKTMLLSHHQPLSAYEGVGQAMTKKVVAALDGKALDAWLWGHEHRCTTYENATPWLRFGSCIGNGGVPQLLPDPVLTPSSSEPAGYAPLTWAYDGDEPADGNNWLRFGFAVLDVNGAELNLEYFDERGDRVNAVTLQ